MRWITALLTWFAADPQAIDTEQPRAAACVCVARATLMQERKQDNAKKDRDTAPTVVKDDSSGQATQERRQQQTDSLSSGLLFQPTPQVEEGCIDGSCVAVPTVRSRVYRSRRGSR